MQSVCTIVMGGGCKFKDLPTDGPHQESENPCVGGSIPPLATKYLA